MTYIIFFSLSWLFNFALFLVLIEMYEFDTYWHVRICDYEAKKLLYGGVVAVEAVE